MPNTAWTILVAAITAVAATTATGLIVTPRMDARKKRLGEIHSARDSFSTHMTMVVWACTRLLNVPPVADDGPEWTPVMRGRLAAERARWLQQIDDATRWMVDNVATYAGRWPLRRLIVFATAYAANARMVVLSEREEATKLRHLLVLTMPVQRQFFGWPWSRARYYFADRRAFAETMARLEREATAR
ncbi:hypothetical protein [Streptomyces sp. WM6378]|uniref:hypothetical protein n=1 Tax=Streptomyces sp. WM6378 TaxID=1415557 RepID=UPI0006AFB86F|nr:hypothetical protein [Streptomyces sp. WM6378]KOU54024.1 hypothetical protein ADK54_02695 [Streptomyces sp. WM6378]